MAARTKGAEEGGKAAKKAKTVPGPIARSPTPRAPKVEAKALRILSVNVAGLRTLLDEEKGAAKRAALMAVVAAEEPHLVCLNEHKLKTGDVEAAEAKLRAALPRYAKMHWACSGPPGKNGYSGVAMLVRDDAPDGLVTAVCTEGLAGVARAASCDIATHEGRVLTLEHPAVSVVSVYVPNSGQDLKRLNYRVADWDKMFGEYVQALEHRRGVPVVVVGDLNCAHGAADIHNMYVRPNFEEMRSGAVALEDQYVGLAAVKKQAGLTAEERTSFGALLEEAGLVDTFRHYHPSATGVFSYFSQRVVQNKPNNRGLRLDYVLASRALVPPSTDDDMTRPKMHDSFILDECEPIADHAAVGATLLLP